MIDLYGGQPGIRLGSGNVVILASKDQAARILSHRDDFLMSMGPFDRMIRMKATSPVSVDNFRRFVGESILDWEPQDAGKVMGALEALGQLLKKYARWLPNNIYIIKTSGDEEFKCAYTRSNAVILPLSRLDRTVEELQRLLIHEFFHILTRHNPALREQLYSIIGFHPCGRIQMPASIEERSLTNPDSPGTDFYINVGLNGEQLQAVPIILLTKDIRDIRPGEGIMDYVAMLLMAVEARSGGWGALCRNGEPVIVDAGQASGFYEQIGRNTGYTICPEEVLAENFTLLATGQKGSVPTPEILDRMERLLTG